MHMVLTSLSAIAGLMPLLSILAVAAHADEQPCVSRKQLTEAKNYLFERAVHPETHLIYGGIKLEDPDRWKSTVFPTPESIRNRICDDSERPNVSNCPIANGIFLGAIIDCHALTQCPECAQQARTVFDGLRTLARASSRKGFIARSVLPGDPTKAHLLNSSVDQYTYYVQALWKYYRSPLAGEAEKEEIRKILHEICTMIEEDGTILATNGIPVPMCDIEAIRSDRSSRLLEVYLVGHDVTGNPHWRERYLEKAREADHARLKSLLDPEKVLYPHRPRDTERDIKQSQGAILQTQYSLVPLVELETDLPLRACYVEAMRINARVIERHAKINQEGLLVMLLAESRWLSRPALSVADEPRLDRLRMLCADLLAKDHRPGIVALAAQAAAVQRGVLKLGQ